MSDKPRIRAINYLADNFGCGFYRMRLPGLALQTSMNLEHEFRITEALDFVGDPKYYMNFGGVNMVRIQRWYGAVRQSMVEQFLKPLSIQLGFWLVYEIDDVLLSEEIPAYNVAKKAYEPPEVRASVKRIMELCDMITVTTPELADVYSRKFEIPRERFLVIPNYLPKWWIGDRYSLEGQLALYRNTRKKPRIAFACSMNHFDIENQNNGVDDFSHIIPWIEQHIAKDDLQFIFVGGVPKQLEKYLKPRKIEYQPPSDFLNYPRELKLRGIDLLLAPLADNLFNRCKSNIKWIEFSALGIPMFGQDIPTYSEYTDQLFKDGNDLENIVDRLFFRGNSEEQYRDIIVRNHALIDADPKHSPRGWWLENNVGQYDRLYSMKTKTLPLDIRTRKPEKAAEKKAEEAPKADA